MSDEVVTNDTSIPAETVTTSTVETTPQPSEATPPAAAPPKPATDSVLANTPEPVAPLEIKLPDGWAADAPVLEQFRGLLSDEKLTAQERAQKIVDMHVAQVSALHAKAEALEQETVAAWHKRTAEDKDIGGDKLPEAMANARLALKKAGDDELFLMLAGDEAKGIPPTWLGSCTPLLKLLSRVGSMYREGGFSGVGGVTARDPLQAHLEARYPTMYPRE
jgi:hypothetical protein